MTKDEALTMAIEALLYGTDHTKAVKACKEALEPEIELADTISVEDYQKLREQPVVKESLTVQEPLTHVIGLDSKGYEAVVKLQSPLYTHPKEWQGLSDYEIFKIEGLDCVDEEYIKRFARAIETKLKEKNNASS
jgi:hypothetical protein